MESNLIRFRMISIFLASLFVCVCCKKNADGKFIVLGHKAVKLVQPPGVVVHLSGIDLQKKTQGAEPLLTVFMLSDGKMNRSQRTSKYRYDGASCSYFEIFDDDGEQDSVGFTWDLYTDTIVIENHSVSRSEGSVVVVDFNAVPEVLIQQFGKGEPCRTLDAAYEIVGVKPVGGKVSETGNHVFE
jgi:hypothetical protein